MKKYLASSLALFLLAAAPAPTPPETHRFRIVGQVDYRCYAGTGAVKAVDSRTKAVCDNKELHQKLFDEVVALKIVNEPTPDAALDLEGSWLKTVPFKGRGFEIAISLFKSVPSRSPRPYRLRAVAHDDEPGTRSTAVYAEAETPGRLNVLTIEVTSAGQPEEITFNAVITPVP